MTEKFRDAKVLMLIKENLNLILIIPALLGGLWQLIELSSLSLSFLRFFSVTQLVADGILIMLIFSFLIGSVLLLPIYSFWVIPPKDNLKEIKYEEPKKEFGSYMDKKPILSIFFFYSLVLSTAYGLGNYQVYGLQELLIYTVIGFLSIYFVRYLYLNERKSSIEHKKIVYLSTIFVFIIMFAYVAIFCKHVHDLFLLPQNLKNIEKLKNKISSENPNDNIKILYSNDKYIFIELKDKKSHKEKITIIPFENLTR